MIDRYYRRARPLIAALNRPLPLWLRWTIALSAAILLCACKEQLQSRVSESDANEILATLYSAGIHASKGAVDDKTWSVEVDKDDLQRALQMIRDHGLPREQFSNTGELFKKEGLVSTPSEERIRYIYAVSQELAHTLSEIDGVVSARVHPVIPANDPLANQIRPASASVFIKHRREANLQAMAPAIKNLVMHSIEGLTYENISLTFVTAEESPRTDATLMISPSHTSTEIVIGVLVALLLCALVGLAALWRKYRAALSRRGWRPATNDEGVRMREPNRQARWPARLRQWWTQRSSRRAARGAT